MADITYQEQRKRFYLKWVPSVFFKPRRAFQDISARTQAVWLAPLLILSILVLINVLIAGRIKNQAALSGEITYPPDYQYYTPEQQAQYMQSVQAMQGPVFVYVLPGLTAVVGVWFGWLVLGGIIHLATTLFGGRGSTAISMNIVAWGSLPLALREMIQIIYMLVTHRLISSAGLSGFSPATETGWLLFLGQFLKLIDIYVIWQIILIILGVRLSTSLSPSKSISSVLISMVIILLLRAGLAYLFSLLGNLTIARPFFF